MEDVDEVEDSVVADVSELPVAGLSVSTDCVLLDSDVLLAMLGVLAVL